MAKQIDFYFDFISPYSFLAHKRIRIIENKNNIKFKYKPILLGGLHNQIGITAPAFISLKSKYMKNDCKMIAKKLKISFIFNPLFPINSLNLMRGLLTLNLEKEKKYIDLFFDAYWKHGLNLNSEKVILNILKKCDVDIKTFKKAIQDQKIKNKLKKFTNNAFKKNIFGAPTFVVNNKIFWGQDRLDYALEEFAKSKN